MAMTRMIQKQYLASMMNSSGGDGFIQALRFISGGVALYL
jgi:hypothetical protein